MAGWGANSGKHTTKSRRVASRRGPSALLSLGALSGLGYLLLRTITRGTAASDLGSAKAAASAFDPAVASAKMFTDIPARSWRKVTVNVYKRIDDDRVLAVAAGVAFYALLAIFPSVTTMVSLYGVFKDRAQVVDDIASLSIILPDGAVSIMSEQALRIASGAPLSLGFAALFSFLLAVWSANSGMKALMDALNVAYGKPETRSFLRLNLMSFTFTIGGMAFLILMLSAVAIVPAVLQLLWLDQWTQWLIWAGRWPIMMLLLGLAISVLYRWGPNVRSSSWRWYTPGSIVASVGLLGFSMLFSWYAANFAAFNETYGSLGAVIAFLAWMWLSTAVVLIGAELNAELDRRLGDRQISAPSR